MRVRVKCATADRRKSTRSGDALTGTRCQTRAHAFPTAKQREVRRKRKDEVHLKRPTFHRGSKEPTVVRNSFEVTNASSQQPRSCCGRTVSRGLAPIPGSSCAGAASGAPQLHAQLFPRMIFCCAGKPRDAGGLQLRLCLLWVRGRWCRGERRGGCGVSWGGGGDGCPAQLSSYPQQREGRVGNAPRFKPERRW